MTDHFIKLIRYDRYANLQLLPLITATGNPEKPVRLMAHLLAAQQAWLRRVKLMPNANEMKLWEDNSSPEVFEKQANDNHDEWITFISDPDNHDLDRVISYKSFQGVQYSSTLLDIYTHIINHGTHHRAQIGQHLKLAGIEQLPVLDYIAFTRL